MSAVVLAGSAAIAVAVAACRAEDRGARSPDHEGSDVTAAGPDPLHVELLVEPQARAGEPVRLELRVENVGGQALDLYLRGRTTTFDVTVTRAGGGVVWRRLEGETIPAIVHIRALRPGERWELHATWEQRTNAGEAVTPGDYVVEGSLLTETGPLRTPPRPLRIVAARK